ncbi:MAG: ABC transporter ATP-binding protein [Burkholderiaceae bacterium]|nr:ABC transporter ATP-binding protein [Burkholderiaceae bacterium]
MTTPVLRLQGITKRFGALTANDDISLQLARGEVLALLGENGAGKSTLMSILFGHYVADAGTIEVDGRTLPPGQPRAALAAGIGMVHQHFTLADNLSVLDNVLLGREALWQPFSRRTAARARLLALAQRFGLVVDPEARVGDLSVGERQRVEILKALTAAETAGGGARVLILDEPTAVLTPQETASLFASLRQMVASGVALIFISHKLDEVLQIAHRVAVLRGGRLVADLPAADVDKPMLAEAMVGRTVAPAVRREHARGEAVCSVPGTPLVLYAGEIVAIAGVAGNGQAALAERLCGLGPDTVLLRGRTLPARPRDFVAAGVARIPEDRHAVGLVGDLALWENAVLERYATPRFARAGVIRRGAARAHAQAIVERFDVRGGGLDRPVRALSGGNMQKLILGRALIDGDATLIVADQPTWGLDVGAVADVHQRLLDAAAGGAAVLLISEDLDEIFALADRIAVIHAGQLTEARPAAQWTLADIGLAMAGHAATAEAVA